MMKSWIYRSFIAALLLLTSCGPQMGSQLKTRQQSAGSESSWPTIQKIDDNTNNDVFLISTDQEFQKLPDEVKAQFEKPKTEIKTKSATLRLGLTDIEKIEYLYDQKNNTLQLKGNLKLRSKEDNTILAENAFSLNGKHNIKKQVVNLYEESHTDEIPLVRSKVTCLSTDDNDGITCDKAIIDFFISYKGQYFTEQFETTTKKALSQKKYQVPAATQNAEPTYNDIPALPTSHDQTTVSSTDSSVADAAESAEGSDDSINDRYEGQIQDTDIVAFMNKTKPENTDEDDDNSDEDATPPLIEPQTPPPQIPSPQVTPTQPGKTPSVPKPSTAPSPGPSQTSSQDITTTPLIEKIINSNFIQLANGEVRQHNQAIGYPDDGKLRNPTVMKDFKGNGDVFVLVAPERARFYATHEMATMITRLGKFSQLGDIQKIYVGNISAAKGGPLSPHLSHQIGMDADLGYPTLDGKTSFPTVVRNNSLNSSAYSVKKTFELFKEAFKQKDIQTEKIFADRLIIKDLCQYAAKANELSGQDKDLVQNMFKNINHVDGHGNHFHIRVKCTKYQPGCRSKVYKAYPGCEGYVKK